ncbi:EPIDERMAL PATTERNING FACTOR-like protein 1 [Phragmites australis]|uniref:EPIDERMAL PATTERNING FACTOR-like protein 1 n=1 Tax=Phragmites australis TaxID=29695 RepID=UPI002D7A2F4B|nr:EPIDERMAL PATTERNING FACTOR-like protein 1 [Phragmites australis]
MSERAHARAHFALIALWPAASSAMRPAATPVFLTGAVFMAAFLGLLLEAACVPRLPPPLSSRLQGGGTAGEEEKVRLGSSPPSCRGRCYECSPCTAVQVPTLSPSGPAIAATTSRPRARADQVPLVTMLSNYKPVGWQCQCRDRLYVP